MLSVTVAHAAAVARFPHHHGDPFDRLLVAQQPVVKVWRRTETGEAPRRQGATTKNTGSICGRSNAAGGDASPVECSQTFTTGCQAHLEHLMIVTSESAFDDTPLRRGRVGAASRHTAASENSRRSGYGQGPRFRYTSFRRPAAYLCNRLAISV